MKMTYVAALAVVSALVLIAGQAAAHGGPFVHRLHVVGKGFGIPADGNLNSLLWIDKVAVGTVKADENVTDNDSLNTKRVGIMHVTDSQGSHRYKLRNIRVDDNGTVTAEVWDTGQNKNTSLGSLSVQLRTIGGKEAWTGPLTIGSWQGTMVVHGRKVTITDDDRDRMIDEERLMKECTDETDCEFRHHMRHTVDDARSRDFLKDKCTEDDHQDRCRTLLQTFGQAKARTHATQILPAMTLQKLRIRQVPNSGTQ